MITVDLCMGSTNAVISLARHRSLLETSATNSCRPISSGIYHTITVADYDRKALFNDHCMKAKLVVYMMIKSDISLTLSNFNILSS